MKIMKMIELAMKILLFFIIIYQLNLEKQHGGREY